jgi:transposase InsO family protein
MTIQPMSHIDERITKIRICNSLINNGISPENIPKQIGIHRATVYRWIKGIKLYGINEFIKRYRIAKKGRRKRNKTNPIIKIHVFNIRNEYKNCCGQKIQYILNRDYKESIAISTIYKILGEKYSLRSKWKKYSKRGFVKKGGSKGDSIQVDTVDLGSLYAFTAIDTYTKEASILIKSKLTSTSGKQALKSHINDLGSIRHIQRDGGSEFKKEWQEYAIKNIVSIRTARPYKKNEQAFIERFNGIFRKECVSYNKYKKKDIKQLQNRVDEFLDYYHYKRPHISLNMMTPKEFAKQSTQSLCRI